MATSKKYVYIGEYFHRKRDDWLPPAEKKIGITANPRKRERELSHTKGTIAFMILAAWEVGGRAREVEKILQRNFGEQKVLGEWFYDEDNTLIDSVADLMGIGNHKRINLNTLRDATDVKQAGSEADKIRKQGRKRAANARRPKLTLKDIGIKVGDKLVSVFDKSFVAVVVEGNRVEFEGKVWSLPLLAGELRQRVRGGDPGAENANTSWLHNGEQLYKKKHRHPAWQKK